MGALLIAIGIASAVSSQVLADEFKAWAPWLIKKFVAFAIRRLPEMHRERYEEEWTCFVAEIPGDIGKVLAAVGLGCAGIKIAFELNKNKQALTTNGSKNKKSSLVVRIIIFNMAAVCLLDAVLVYGLRHFCQIENGYRIQQKLSPIIVPNLVLCSVLFFAALAIFAFFFSWLDNRARGKGPSDGIISTDFKPHEH